MFTSRRFASVSLFFLLSSSAFAAPPADAEEFDCPLPALSEGKVFVSMDGWIWLMDGEVQIASTHTTATLHDSNSVTCNETKTKLMSQGSGTMVVSFVDIDWSAVLPARTSSR